MGNFASNGQYNFCRFFFYCQSIGRVKDKKQCTAPNSTGCPHVKKIAKEIRLRAACNRSHRIEK